MALKNPGLNDQWLLIKQTSKLSPMEYPWLMGFSVFSLSYSFIIGILGLYLTLKFQKESRPSQDTEKASEKDSFTIELNNE